MYSPQHSKYALFPLIFVMGLDLWFTLAGQPEVYWKGMYYECDEMSPAGKILLRAGPAYFISAYAAYTVAVCLIVRKLKKSLDTVFVMGVILGHAWGSSSWIPLFAQKVFNFELNDGGIWLLHIVYFGFIALVCGIFFGSGPEDRPSGFSR